MHAGRREEKSQGHTFWGKKKCYPVGLSWQSIWNPHYSSYSFDWSPLLKCQHVLWKWWLINPDTHQFLRGMNSTKTAPEAQQAGFWTREQNRNCLKPVVLPWEGRIGQGKQDSRGIEARRLTEMEWPWGWILPILLSVAKHNGWPSWSHPKCCHQGFPAKAGCLHLSLGINK